jgi:mono/diheme cytochrome c family protein
MLAAVWLASTYGQAPAAGGPAEPDPAQPPAAQVTQPEPVQVTQPRQVQSDPNLPEANQPSASPSPADPQMIAAGQRMYKDYCQRCHGLNMVSPGGAFFDLRKFPTDQKSRFVNSVVHGKRAMPAWGAVLEPDEIDLLWAYVSSRGATR